MVKMQPNKKVWQRRKHFFAVPWICFPPGHCEQSQTLSERVEMDEQRKGDTFPLLVNGVYSEQTRIYFCNGFTSFPWKTPKRILPRVSSAAKHHQAGEEHGKCRSLCCHSLLSFSSSPFRSFHTLTLCKILDNCPSCASLNSAATM